jgi:hypothetical protein
MHSRFLLLITAFSLALILQAHPAAADPVTWVLRRANGQAVTLQGNAADGGDFYLDYSLEPRPGKGVQEAEKVDWSDTVLQEDSGPVSLSVGLQAPGESNLILQSGPRRGVAAQIGSDPASASLTAFVLQERETGEAPGKLSLNDSANRLAGARLFLGQGDSFPFQGSATVILGPEGATAWSLASETRIYGPLRLEGEVAGTGVPGDTPGSEVALRGGLSTASRLPFFPGNYRLELGWKRVGSGFESPAFPGQEKNMECTSLQGGLSWRAVGLDAAASNKRENVDRLPGIPTAEVWQTSLGLTLSPEKILSEGAWPFFLEHPAWRFYHQTSCRLAKTSGDVEIEEGQMDVSGLSLRFGAAPCAWEVDWKLSTQEDIYQGDSQNQQVDLKAFLGPSVFQFKPFLSFTTTSGGADGGETRGMTTGLAGLYQPDAPWKGNLVVSVSRQASPEVRNESLQVNGRVGWSGAGAKAGKPGIELSLDGGFRATTIGNDGEGDGTEECSVLLSLKIPLPS